MARIAACAFSSVRSRCDEEGDPPLALKGEAGEDVDDRRGLLGPAPLRSYATRRFIAASCDSILSSRSRAVYSSECAVSTGATFPAILRVVSP